MLLGGYILPEAEARRFTNLKSDRYNIVHVASKLDDMIRNVEIIPWPKFSNKDDAEHSFIIVTNSCPFSLSQFRDLRYDYSRLPQALEKEKEQKKKQFFLSSGLNVTEFVTCFKADHLTRLTPGLPYIQNQKSRPESQAVVVGDTSSSEAA